MNPLEEPPNRILETFSLFLQCENPFQSPPDPYEKSKKNESLLIETPAKQLLICFDGDLVPGIHKIVISGRIPFPENDCLLTSLAGSTWLWLDSALNF